MTLAEAIEAIRSAPDRHKAQTVANDVAIACMSGQRDPADEKAVRTAWFERWGSEWREWLNATGDCGPRAGSNWTGD